MNGTAESPRESVLDALACLMAIDRGDIDSADAMLKSYAATGEVVSLLQAITAVAVCAIRYSAIASGQTSDKLLAGVAAELRAQ